MKRFFFIVLLLISAVALVWLWNWSKQSLSDQCASDEPITIERLEAKLLEVKTKLQDNEERRVRCTADRDTLRSEFNQRIRRVKGKSAKEIKAELVKENSELDSELWFQEIKGAWMNLKALERDVIILSRQDDHYKKTQLQLERLIEKIGQNGKDSEDVSEDAELENLIAQGEVLLQDSKNANLSSIEATDINIEVNSHLEAVENNASKIPGLELTFDELPKLPVLTKEAEKPNKAGQVSLLNRIKNDINKNIKEAKGEAHKFLNEKQPEEACYSWLNVINQLAAIVTSANLSGEYSEGFFQDYSKELDSCQKETMKIITRPYRKTLAQCVKDLGSKEPDWTLITESLEGFYRIVNQINVKLSSSETKTFEELLDTIDLHLDYLVMQNDLNSKIISKRLNTILDKIDNEYFPERFVARHYKKSVQLFEQKKYQKALSEIELCIAKEPTKSDYLNHRQAIEDCLFNPGDRKEYTVNGVEFAFRWCPSGTYLIGSPSGEERRDEDEVQHSVTLSHGYWMLETEVTQKQWKAVMGNNPSYFKGDNLPVEQVSWDDCQDFCNKCSSLGLPVQLPTEAQWEIACRAGITGTFSDNLEDVAWYIFNSADLFIFFHKTHPVGTKNANAWGLYDMHGNVWEICQDWYDAYPNESVTDPTGPSSGSYHVIRGGSYNETEWRCRSANRGYRQSGYQSYNLGFRVVRGL